MNKILRYSFVALLAMVGLNVMADTDVTFTLNDPDAITALGITVPASGQGTKIESISKDGVTITATTAAGKTDTRIFQGSGKNAGKYDFRVYTDGTLTFTAASNNIKKIVITGTGSMDKLSRDGYTVSDDKQTGTWEGDAQTVTLTATGTATIYTITVTYGASTETRTATTINFAEGYQTQIAKGPDGMFPEIGSSVALPTATVMAGDAAVAGANIEWSLEVKSWKEKSEGELPILKEGRISFEGHGVVSVKAAFAGNDAYQPSSKSYTLTIYNSYGLLKEMANDIADPDCTKDDDDDKDGSPVFYFFRNIDGAGLPVATSTVTYANGKYIYLTDGEGANLLFYGTNSQNLKQGDVISGNVSETNLGGFWGTLKRYNKLPEFVFTDMNVKVESEGAAVAPTTITVDQLKDYINAYVKVENAEFVSADGKNLTFKVGETNLAVYNQFNVDATALEATAKYTIVGMGCVYKKSSADAVYQLYPISFTKTAEAGINEMKANAKFEGKIYNVAGQVVNKGYKGLVIVNGKKMLQK